MNKMSDSQVKDDGAGISRKELQGHIDATLDAVIEKYGPFTTPRQQMRVVRAVLRYAYARLAKVVPLCPQTVMGAASDTIATMQGDGVPLTPETPTDTSAN